MFDDVNDFLGGSSAPVAKFPTVGTVIRGKVIKAEVQNETDFKTKQVRRYPDGNPIKMVVIILQTEERDATLEDDDGVRRVYARGGMVKAIRQALGKQKFLPGGTLAIKYVADEDSGGAFPRKVYAAKYEPPIDDLPDVDPF